MMDEIEEIPDYDGEFMKIIEGDTVWTVPVPLELAEAVNTLFSVAILKVRYSDFERNIYDYDDNVLTITFEDRTPTNSDPG